MNPNPSVAHDGVTYQTVDSSLGAHTLNVKGDSPVANSGFFEFAKGLSEAKPLTGDNQRELPTFVGGAAVCPTNELPSGERAVAGGPPEGPPPSSNTGVHFTNSGIVHWMRFTVPLGRDGGTVAGAELARSIYEQLTGAAKETATAIGYGYSGYSDGLRLPGDGAWICWHKERPDMGVCVNLPGEALPLLPFDPRAMVAWVHSMGGHFTRLDVAVDTDQVHISEVRAAVERGDLVSRSQKQEYYGHFKTDAFTIYVGSRTSERFVRIYNKAAEQGLDDTGLDDSPAERAALAMKQDVELTRKALREAEQAKRDAEQARQSAKLTWLKARLGATSKQDVELTRKALREAEQAKRDAERALLESKQALLEAKRSDTAAEQLLLDERKALHDDQSSRIWTRCEVEFKKEQAEVAARYIVAGTDLRSLIFSAIDFRDRAADSNVKRCPQLPWWSAWIGAVERVSFAVAKSLTDSVAKVYTWIQKQVAPSLSFLNEFFGVDSSWFDRLCDAGRSRIPEHRWGLLDAEGSWGPTPVPEPKQASLLGVDFANTVTATANRRGRLLEATIAKLKERHGIEVAALATA